MPAENPFPTSEDMAGRAPAEAGTSPAPGAAAGTVPAKHHTTTASDGGDVLGRVVQGAHHTIDRLAETAAPHVQRLGTQAEHVRQVGDEWTASLRGTVRDHPLASVATALALGVLVARLTQR